MKITHVAEIVNIGHVARILEAEICGAKNVHAIPVYNPSILSKVMQLLRCAGQVCRDIWPFLQQLTQCNEVLYLLS